MVATETKIASHNQRQADGSGTIQVVSFRLANEEYGIEITKVQEIILVGEITRVPQTSPCGARAQTGHRPRLGCMRPEDIDSEVIAAIGELTNMIAGGAKTALADLQMSISLPSVIAGRNHTVSFPTGAVPIGIPFESKFGPLALEVSLVVASNN